MLKQGDKRLEEKLCVFGELLCGTCEYFVAAERSSCSDLKLTILIPPFGLEF